MTFECTLKVSGMNPQKSINAFIDSYNTTSDINYYKRYNKRLEDFFVSKIQKNIRQNQIKNKNLDKTFSVNFKNNKIYFTSTSKNALKYEFGSKNMPPKRYIEPAVIETANELSHIIISDAMKLYHQYSSII